MADKGVLVETNLTSNKVILGVEGKTHPFATYRKLGVPVALSTDDEGVSRIDLTHEYVRAVEDFGLTYAELKELVRNSLEYSFLPGSSLWDDKGAICARCRIAKPTCRVPTRLRPLAPRFCARARRPPSNGSSSAASRLSRRASKVQVPLMRNFPLAKVYQRSSRGLSFCSRPPTKTAPMS